MPQAKTVAKEELTFLGISGINFPTKKRQYLMDLLKEAAEKHNPKFIISAGNTVDGRSLEKELKGYLRFELGEQKENKRQTTAEAKSLVKKKKTLQKQNKKEAEKLAGEIDQLLEETKRPDQETLKRELTDEFIDNTAYELSYFLPRIKGADYIIAVSEKVYDRPLGVRILERLTEMRNDIRLIGQQQDGSYDAEPKIPTFMKGFEEIRVIVPRHAPWFYRIITSFMQRLINAFIPRTFSPPPQLMLVGCTGTASYLPFYEGVPCISVPTLHKIEEQTSTENMVGCSVIRVTTNENGPTIVNGVYDFRPAIFNEKQFAIPKNTTRMEKSILDALMASSANLRVILFRIQNSKKRKNGNGVDEEKAKKALQKLLEAQLISYSDSSHRYAINEELIKSAKISLNSLFEGSKKVRHTLCSCFHCGCLKSLYYTALHYLPHQAVQSEVFIENGDGIQGIAHNYEYNGELLPITYGFDKQEILLAGIRARNILDIFRLKYAALKNKKIPTVDLLDACLIKYVYNLGNHPSWKHYNKDALILYLFETKLREYLLDGLLTLGKELKINGLDYNMVKAALGEKIVRVGESKIVNLNGVVVGIKHPSKARTQSKSHRIQDVVDFTWRNFRQFAKKIAKHSKGFALANIANFHECAAVHVVKFGRTILGIMTGAYLHDTSFESDKDKVVDWGSANVMAIISQDDRLLYSEVEFNNRIHPEDEKIVLVDRINTSDVNKLCAMLTNEVVDLQWR